MATSAIIKVEGIKFAKVYKHYDGNPDSTLPWLKDFNERFTKQRGDDPGYKFAQLLRSSILEAEQFNLDDSKYTGWGVVEYNIDRCTDFEYTLRKDGTVTYVNLGKYEIHESDY